MKKLICFVLFCALTLMMIAGASDILVPKETNRYYILEQKLADSRETYDVQVFGSCHSYTSFNPKYLEQTHGVSAYVYGNAGEIIPTTYLRMCQQFQEHTPKVALVEIWGINPYETYDSQENILGHYLKNNLERIPFSLEKQEVIRDFETLDSLEMNFAISRYKDRLMDFSLKDIDFAYSFEGTRPYSSDYVYSEMTSRLENNGFKCNPSKAIEDYPQRQNYIEEGEFLEIEPVIVKYLEKIIGLCEKYGVELIFYRSPYTSTENELRKLNHLRQICDGHGVLFIDLEETVDFNYTEDFLDYQHLSETGANKSTDYLASYILPALEN